MQISTDFDYDSLAMLSAVVRTGSFEGAAKSLNVTQSAVSQRIKHLEERVGSILIQRGRPCVATEDGMLLCQHVEQVALLRHELREKLAHRGGDHQRSAISVRIAVNSDSLATWFPSAMARASQELNLYLEVIPDDQEFTEERLRSGDALAVVSSSDTTIPGCRSFPLGAMYYMAVASPDYVKARFPKGPTLAALAESPSIRFDRKDTLPQQWMMLAFGDASRLASHYVPSYEGHLISALQGIGWAMMPSITVEPMVERGELVEVIPGVRVRTALYWQTRAQSSQILARLSEIVGDEAANWLSDVEAAA